MTAESNSPATLEISNLSIEFPGRTGPRRVVERIESHGRRQVKLSLLSVNWAAGKP